MHEEHEMNISGSSNTNTTHALGGNNPMPTQSDGDMLSPPSTRKTRTRNGCLNCRRRRRKCDELKPECLNCRQREEQCQWRMQIVFKASNAAEIDVEHPSMVAASRKSVRNFQILDETSQVEEGYQETLAEDYHVENRRLSHDMEQHTSEDPHAMDSPLSPLSMLDPPFEQQQSEQLYALDGIAWQSQSPLPNNTELRAATNSDKMSYHAEREQRTSMCTTSGSHASRSEADCSQYSDHLGMNELIPKSASEINSASGFSTTRLRTDDEIVAAGLLSLAYPPSQELERQIMHNTSDTDSQPFDVQLIPPSSTIGDTRGGKTFDHNLYNDHDGIFLPGSAYFELHTTLRDHLIYTARSNIQTRSGTPEQQQPNMSLFEDLSNLNDYTTNNADITPQTARSSKQPELSLQRQYILWKTWVDEVAPWLDKFDNKRHFERKISLIAKNVSHLRFSILALCARQIERKGNSSSSAESLGLYQEAIHLLLPELHTKDTAVIATCVILCVLEMMSCAPKQWRRHLEGCANLLESMGITGFVGGVESALFWCFARMDVCGALISQDLTLIPVHNWASKFDLTSDVILFRDSSQSFDTYANYAVFLCAHCVTYLKRWKTRTRETEGTIWNSQWTELLALLADWYAERPEQMKPILTIPVVTSTADSPFPTVLYGNAAAVSGNQLYHTSMLLMLQDKPSAVKVQANEKSFFWHARQICAISESNTHHGAWTNSIQPMWIAGKVMSHPSEHRAIICVLERIQRETGWQTSWRIKDLKDWWGDSED